MCVSSKSQVILMLLVRGPHSETLRLLILEVRVLRLRAFAPHPWSTESRLPSSCPGQGWRQKSKVPGTHGAPDARSQSSRKGLQDASKVLARGLSLTESKGREQASVQA